LQIVAIEEVLQIVIDAVSSPTEVLDGSCCGTADTLELGTFSRVKTGEDDIEYWRIERHKYSGKGLLAARSFRWMAGLEGDTGTKR
jgi:hypothetical protein